jgi:hypothetical protein
MPMTPADVIQIMLELDQQQIRPRPSAWGKAAMIVRDLCFHAEGSFRGPMGDLDSLDMGAVHCPAPQTLNQPLTDRIIRETVLHTDFVRTLIAALRMWDHLPGFELCEERDTRELAELCEAHGWRGELPLGVFVHQFRKRVLKEVMG